MYSHEVGYVEVGCGKSDSQVTLANPSERRTSSPMCSNQKLA
jgi:hypothetical protein